MLCCTARNGDGLNWAVSWQNSFFPDSEQTGDERREAPVASQPKLSSSEGGGLGIVIMRSSNGQAFVKDVRQDGPAGNQVQPGDEVVSVNRVFIAGKGSEDVRALLSCPAGSGILLGIRRNGVFKDVTIFRPSTSQSKRPSSLSSQPIATSSNEGRKAAMMTKQPREASSFTSVEVSPTPTSPYYSQASLNTFQSNTATNASPIFGSPYSQPSNNTFQFNTMVGANANSRSPYAQPSASGFQSNAAPSASPSFSNTSYSQPSSNAFQFNTLAGTSPNVRSPYSQSSVNTAQADRMPGRSIFQENAVVSSNEHIPWS